MVVRDDLLGLQMGSIDFELLNARISRWQAAGSASRFADASECPAAPQQWDRSPSPVL